MAPLLSFTWIFGLFLGCLSLLLDRPISSLIDVSLFMLFRQALPHAPAAPVDGAAPSMQQLARFALVTPLRLSSGALASVVLYGACLRDTLPRCLRDVSKGYDEGFRMYRRSRVNPSVPADEDGAHEASLHRVMSLASRSIAVVQAARAAAFGVAFAVMLEWASRRVP